MQTSILEGAAANEAKLVLADNLYMYGDPQGQPIAEDSPQNPHTKKGKVRKAMADAALAAHKAGKLEVAISRPSNYFGPGYDVAAAMVFRPALRGRRMQFLGRLDQPHTYSYIPDVGKAMAILGTSEQGWGQVWIPPVQPALTQTEFARRLWTAAGQLGQPKAQALGNLTVRLGGLFVPAIRETVEMMYEFNRPYPVDSAKFERTFGIRATPLEEAIRKTLEFYRETGTVPADRAAA